MSVEQMIHNHLKLYFLFLFAAAVFISTTISAVWAVEESSVKKNDTLLMFVGEDIDVLSIASRREESAWQAPAVATVITREEIWEKGVKTLSQALEMTPGFYMAQKEWGSESYLRGIPNSVLFLYDTVPMGSDVTKSLQPLDHELSLVSVKRIEVIRGPGSVLWGPDAFAGIVNVVPMTGKDLDGVETGILYGAPGNQAALYANMGHDGGDWDLFMSVRGRSGEEDDTAVNIVRFWGDDGENAYPYEDRFGNEQPDRSRYFEASGRFSFRDWFSISGLISDYKKPYAITGPTESSSQQDLTWPESRGGPFGYVKLEADKDIDSYSGLRFTGYYNWQNSEYEVIDRSFDQKESSVYGELIYDRSFFSGKGVFTGGMAYRQTDVKNAPLWESYFPDYVAQQDTTLLPLYTLKDYDARLWSLFGQYTHKIGDFDLLAGLRNDNHDQYKDALSYNAGVVWNPRSEWIFKLLYGTAYRTPYVKQLLDGEEPELEEIETLNLQVSWKPTEKVNLTVGGFTSKIENHLMEDPYAGLSEPNHQKIYGVELMGNVFPIKQLSFSANLTLLNNSGPDETYNYIKYWDPEPHYEDLNFPYNTGPKTLFNLTGTWRPMEKVTLFARLGYHSSTQLIYPRADSFTSISGAWLLDTTATITDIAVSGLDLQISIRNLTNTHYEIPGTYSSIEGEPISAEIVLRKRW